MPRGCPTPAVKQVSSRSSGGHVLSKKRCVAKAWSLQSPRMPPSSVLTLAFRALRGPACPWLDVRVGGCAGESTGVGGARTNDWGLRVQRQAWTPCAPYQQKLPSLWWSGGGGWFLFYQGPNLFSGALNWGNLPPFYQGPPGLSAQVPRDLLAPVLLLQSFTCIRPANRAPGSKLCAGEAGGPL